MGRGVRVKEGLWEEQLTEKDIKEQVSYCRSTCTYKNVNAVMIFNSAYYHPPHYQEWVKYFCVIEQRGPIEMTLPNTLQDIADAVA